jgi:hypothetical protein
VDRFVTGVLLGTVALVIVAVVLALAAWLIAPVLLIP